MAGKIGLLAGGLSASEGHSHLMGPQQLSAATCATMTWQQQEMLTQLATEGPGGAEARSTGRRRWSVCVLGLQDCSRPPDPRL